ncbi:MAG TPA: hypothetical protein VMM56_11685 [Planctomycetaceae bacterium]|nr:hypothetical protein [Planctomycetaceae bacterium]
MVQELLVEEIECGEKFAREFGESFLVDAAFWLYPTDSDRWHLYLASKDIVDGDRLEAYREVHRLMGTRRFPWLDVTHIKVREASDPLAVKVIEIRDQKPAPIPTRYNGTSIAGLEIEGSYIYPPLAAPSSAS